MALVFKQGQDMKYNAEQITYMLAEAIEQDREYKSWHVSTRHLMALVERVVAEEREACAKVVENILLAEGADVDDVILRLAEDIRARGQA
jgi:hypothetical protein